jgi:hypothetical protein
MVGDGICFVDELFLFHLLSLVSRGIPEQKVLFEAQSADDGRCECYDDCILGVIR